LEETLVNAVFHKSYREPEPVEIRIYVDSIQILNYPGLAKWINLVRFVSGKVKGRKYRNRRIGELFKEIDLSDKKGTGIPNNGIGCRFVHTKLKSKIVIHAGLLPTDTLHHPAGQ
jgi:predicted HTH transcriptional regulator